jgi:DNA-binding SARP family transcriptional activator
MRSLRIQLLGGFAVHVDGEGPFSLSARKARALLAYLALPPGRAHSREKLTSLLWGDTPDGQARQAFRQTLSRLRRALGEAGSTLVDVGDTVALSADRVTIDAVQFEAAATSGERASLEQAAALYRGDLLEGLDVEEAPFDEWRLVERERLRELALETLARLLREQTRAEEVAPAIQTALRLLALDPLQEAVHRALMQLLLGQGRRAAALQQYQACVAALQRELGVEPEEATRRLYREILRASRSVATPVPPAGGTLAAGGRAVDAAMVGRQTELDRVGGAITRMLDHGGHVVLVSGEAGLGKSRLVQELAASEAVRTLRVSFGRCHETERALPFRPWIEALRGDSPVLQPALAEALGQGVRLQLATLFPELRESGDAAATYDAPPTLLFEPLLALVGALVAQQPALLVIEDLHWADTMSARFLAFLGRRIHRWPVLVLGTTRPEELVDAPALTQALSELRTDGRLDEIVLGALSEAESLALVRALQPTARAGRDRDRLEREIWSMSDGSPFVIVESVRGLQQGTPVELGRGVRDFVAARLGRLAELPRQCVAVAAAVGREFSFALLTRAARLGEREAADVVEELVRRRVLDAVDDRLDFCHDWIRVVAYEQLLPARRALVHAAIGEALEQLYQDRLDDVADQLGSHYLEAGDFGKAVPRLIRFGELAAQRFALDDSLKALDQARAGAARLPAGERDRWTLEAVLHQGFVLSVLGRARELVALLEAHADAVERVGEGPLVSEYHFRLGLTQYFLGRRDQAAASGARALAEGERLALPDAVGKALHVLSLVATDLGRPREGLAHATRAAAILDQPHTQLWLGLVVYDGACSSVLLGDLDAAAAACARYDVVGRRSGFPRFQAFVRYVESWIQLMRGDVDQAIETARAALEGTARDPIIAALASGILGSAHLDRGDAAAARAVLTELVSLLEARPLSTALVRSLGLLAEAHLLAGDLARAREVAGRAFQVAGTTAAPYNLGIVQRAMGRIHAAAGERADARRCLVDALETFTACEMRLEAARTRLELVSVLAADDQKEPAREHLASALTAFQKANAPRRVERARALAGSLGLL